MTRPIDLNHGKNDTVVVKGETDNKERERDKERMRNVRAYRWREQKEPYLGLCNSRPTCETFDEGL